MIIEAIEQELAKENICLESLGRVSFGKEERCTLRVKKCDRENIPLV